MSTLRVSVWQVGLLVLACLSARSLPAQPQSAAWLGLSPIDPTDYRRPDNWIDLDTGAAPSLAPELFSDIFLDRRAAQAERDPQGNVVIAVGNINPSGAKSVTVESLPFRLVENALFVDFSQPDSGSVIVHNEAELILDGAVLFAGSVFVGGGPSGPTTPGTVTILPEGAVVAELPDALHVWEGSVVELLGGSLLARVIDVESDPQRFRWSGGFLGFEEFVGDVFNSSGLLLAVGMNRRSLIRGDYSQEPDGRLLIPLSGNLSVEGTLKASGSLQIHSSTSDPTPTAGDEYDVLGFGSIEGQFNQVVLPDLPSAFEWDIDDLYTQGIIRVFDPALPAVWTGAAGDDDYFNPANWEQGLVPANNEDVFALTIPAGADVSVPSGQGVRVTRLTQAEGSLIEVRDGASFEVSHDATLSGTISAVGPGASFSAIGPAVQLEGATRLRAEGGGELRLSADQYSVQLDSGSSTLISAEGQGSQVELPMLDTITVDVATDSTFTVSATDGGEIDLTGLATISGVPDGSGELVLRAASGGSVRLGASVVSNRTTLEVDGQDALIAVDGGLTLDVASRVQLIDGGTISLTAPLVNGGTISGTGTLRGAVLNDGLISPGSSIGETEVEGDVSATANSIFSIEIVGGGMEPPRNDRVTATQRMTLAGHLIVMLIEGGMGIFDPLQGDEFELFSAGTGISGSFASVSLPPLPPEDGWKLLYNEQDVSLRVIERLPGDFDADGDVDRNDLLIWQAGVGTLEHASQTDGDANADRSVDGHDLLDYLMSFGRQHVEGLAVSGLAVPEPPAAPLAAVLLMAVSIGAVLRRWTRDGGERQCSHKAWGGFSCSRAQT